VWGGQSEIATCHLDGVKATLYDTVAVATSVGGSTSNPTIPTGVDIYMSIYIIINQYICILFIIGKTLPGRI
jgi:hypothetical protein